MAVYPLTAHWNRKGGSRLTAGLAAVPAVLMAFQMACRVCTKLSQDVKVTG